MIKIAIVGNIASGKSTVEKIIKDKGFLVFDTDKLASEVFDLKTNEIKEKFSKFNILENNKISRKLLGDIVFANKDLKKDLENIIYPELKQKIIKLFDEFVDKGYIFISIPLLFEVGWQDMFDKILFVKTDDKIRLERLKSRNNYTNEEALARMNSQLDQETKAKKSDYVICNDNDLKLLQNEVERFIIDLEENGVQI